MRSTNGLNGTRTSEGHGEGKRATRAEKEQRIVLAMTMIIQGFSKSEIKSTFRTKCGVGGYQTERYLRLARARLAEEDGLGPDFTLEDMRVQHYCIAMQVVSNVDAPARDRLAALKLAGAMYGIGMANKVAPTTPDGQTPYVQASLEALRTMTVAELKLMAEVGVRRDAILARRNAGSH